MSGSALGFLFQPRCLFGLGGGWGWALQNYSAGHLRDSLGMLSGTFLLGSWKGASALILFVRTGTCWPVTESIQFAHPARKEQPSRAKLGCDRWP